MSARMRWWKNGDHPRDDSEEIEVENGANFLSEGKVVRRFRRPDVTGTDLDRECGAPWSIHGWIDDSDSGPHTKVKGGEVVHPGDYVITHDDGTFSVTRPDPMGDALAAAEAAAPDPEPEPEPQAVETAEGLVEPES